MRLLLNILLGVAAVSAAFAQTRAPTPASTPAVHPPFTVADAQKVIPALATALEENYVLTETGKRYAAVILANLAAGRYARFADAGAFAEAVTADLQSVARDAHLVLVAPRTDLQPRLSESPAPSNRPPPIGKSGWIAPGVAYIEFHSFPSDKSTLEKVRKFLTRHARARTLIIDTVHEHEGGWIGEADLLFAELFKSSTDVVAIDLRQSVDKRMGGLAAGPTIRKVDSPAGVVRYVHSVIPSAQPTLANTRVFVLISNRTISAGEHLAFALDRAHRATLIGETTRGAGNVETDFQMPGGYSAVIPFGRAFDPKTGEGWEGVGVKPDIRVPADKALDTALKLAGVRKSGKAALASLR